jgi:alkaline phosphatase D
MKKNVRRDRRQFLANAAAFVPLVYLSGCVSLPTGPNGLFALGVASGEPRSDSVVLWTRLAPAPHTGGGMPPVSVDVAWTISEDEGFTRIVGRGTAMAIPEDAHSVHVQVLGLKPGRVYWYRFIAAGEVSATGRTKTAPATGSTPDSLHFAFASCQQYEQGYYIAHRFLARDELDLVLFLGDYIYETSWGRKKVRRHGAGECRTLGDYRNRYALYKTDPDLRNAHASAPWVVTWDDHEVANDYANDRGEHSSGAEFLRRRTAAYKAFWEHMPLPPSLRPKGHSLTLFRSFDFGTMARFNILDDRQYRDYQACSRPGWIGGARNILDHNCPERSRPDRSLLGMEQEKWLTASLDKSPAQWNILAQQTMMAQWDWGVRGPSVFNTDGWNGYPAARKRLLSHLGQNNISNPLVIGGDVHMTLVADLKPDFNKNESPIVATEICGTSITSQANRNLVGLERVRQHNAHVRFLDAGYRGYIRVALDRDKAIAELRGVDDVRWNSSGLSTRARFIIEDGQPGARIA